MLFLHDAWVNAVTEDNWYIVPEYHEWAKEDNVELVDQTPVIKVDKDTFNYLAFGFNESKELANEVEGRTFYRKNSDRIKTDYCSIITDGNRVLFVRLDEDKMVMLKSKLIPRQHQLVIEMVQDVKEESFPIKELTQLSKYKTYAGLTRNEKESYALIEEILEDITEKDLPMLKYLLSEISYSTYETVRNENFKECVSALNSLPVSVIVKESENIEKIFMSTMVVK